MRRAAPPGVGGLDAALKSSRERRSVTAAGEKLALRSQDGCLHGFRPWLAVFRLSSIGSFERASLVQEKWVCEIATDAHEFLR